MCFTVPVLSSPRPRRSHDYHRKRHTSSLIYALRSSPTQTKVVGGLWNCQSAIQKADFISALASHHSLYFLVLTETWIPPKNSASLPLIPPIHRDRLAEVEAQFPQDLSHNWLFPLQTAKLFFVNKFCQRLRCQTKAHYNGIPGQGTSSKWVLIKGSWVALPGDNRKSVWNTCAPGLVLCPIYKSFPEKLYGFMLRCNFIHKLDTLLSLFPVDRSTLLLLGHFIYPTEVAIICLDPLLSSSNLTLNPSPPTHRDGDILELFKRPTAALDITDCLGGDVMHGTYLPGSWSQSLGNEGLGHGVWSWGAWEAAIRSRLALALRLPASEALAFAGVGR
ncbi:hypothetical protein NFI96_006304 [Prochilodus magdalenae]|nr:hypothetical protein NFI96_006304 [Prochilodus magdalenae]